MEPQSCPTMQITFPRLFVPLCYVYAFVVVVVVLARLFAVDGYGFSLKGEPELIDFLKKVAPALIRIELIGNVTPTFERSVCARIPNDAPAPENC